jgi:hypothetical protein
VPLIHFVPTLTGLAAIALLDFSLPTDRGIIGGRKKHNVADLRQAR